MRRHSCPSALALPDRPENSPSSSLASSSLPGDLGGWLLDTCTHRFKPLQSTNVVLREEKKATYTVYSNMFMCKLWLHRPPPAAATVAGEAPASRSWFCREKSMLYHSAALSTGLGGITRLGFSRTSRTYRKSMLMAKGLCVHRSNININRCLQCKCFDVTEHHLCNHL